MKRPVVNIILLAVFFIMVAAIALLFVAEIHFIQAKQLEDNYRWKKAEQKYQIAIYFNPFNAEYFAQLGKFMFRQSHFRKDNDKTILFKKAEELYKEAIKLNPNHAEYWLLLGHVQMYMDKNRFSEVIVNFKTAIDKDPYNLRNNYLVGRDLFAVWSSLDEEDKNFTLERVKQILSLEPWYGSYFYSMMIYYAEDFNLLLEVTPKTFRPYKILYSFLEKSNLWQYRKRVKELLNSYKEKEQTEEFKKEQAAKLERINRLKKDKTADVFISPNQWQGRSKGGGNIYKNGHMYWTGTMNGLINLPSGKATIYIQAKGSAVDEVWPYMIIELDGEEVGETVVDAAEYKEYNFTVDTEGGLKVLSITFANDGVNKEKGEDRNLHIGEARIKE